jgi:glycosyltransferase involved in cell wall biosynthesis
MRRITVGIDASRNRSGGAKAHLLGILSEVNPLNYGIKEVHLWAPDSLLNELENHSWLIKHSPKELQQSLIKQIWWQATKLSYEAKSVGCDIMFTTDASTFCRFKPMIVLSQDMLSYEPGAMKSYGYTKQRLRLLAILFIQNYAFRFSDGVIFLTEYASKIIQKSTGLLNRVKCIPHGVGLNFRSLQFNHTWPNDSIEPIRCIYISNSEMYKHQWVVVQALSILRANGHNITLQLIGGGEGRAQKLLDESINKFDPEASFVEVINFITHNKVPEYLSKSNIFIFASSCENMPITLIEGMASGLPIACSDRGPMPEVLQDGGVYFNPEDCKSIVLAIEKIIYNHSLRNYISKRAKKLSNKYSWSRCADQTWEFIVDTYRELNNDR